MNRKSAEDVLRLISFLLSPESEESFAFSDEELTQIYDAAKAHSVLALTADALEKAGITSRDFHIATAVARRNRVLFDNELGIIGGRFAENRIRFMPLKGSVLKDCYPRAYEREMTDLDILIEPSDRETVRAIMEDMGYSVIRYGRQNDDVYRKEPMLNVEMHSYLFDSKPHDRYAAYYEGVGDRLIPKEGSVYEYRFTPEDMYIYMVLHTLKHKQGGGVGLRYLLDTCLYLKHIDSGFSWDYVHSELKKTDADEFERQHRRLAEKVFSSQPLDISEEEALDDYINYGIHGTYQHYVDQQIDRSPKKHARLRYVVKRAFPTGSDIPRGYSFFEKHKALLPALWAYRPIKAITHYPGLVGREIKAVMNDKDKKHE